MTTHAGKKNVIYDTFIESSLKCMFMLQNMSSAVVINSALRVNF